MISRLRQEKGFTIVELLIVIVVIAILAGLVLTAFNGIQEDARDTERRTDINAVYEHLEFYAAKNGGVYPTAANLADTAWVSANLSGLDPEALVDPNGGGYTYTVTPSGCDNTATNCESFTVGATLEDGNTFSRQSLQ